jgi:glucose-6-phosphate 1-dehydrogenase
MAALQSDALVFFGATGDLAYKKIFPALQAMIKRGTLSVPVVGVAKSGWKLDDLKARARDSLEHHGGLDPAAFDKLRSLLRYVDGDYADRATFDLLRGQLGDARRPAHYLAIPPVMFPVVVEQLGRSGCTRGARVIVEKPFGRDLASARQLNQVLLGNFDESAIFRIDHFLGKEPVQNLLFFRSPMRSSSRFGIAISCAACRSPWLSRSASRGGGHSTKRPERFAMSCKTTSCRCWRY